MSDRSVVVMLVGSTMDERVVAPSKETVLKAVRRMEFEEDDGLEISRGSARLYVDGGKDQFVVMFMPDEESDESWSMYQAGPASQTGSVDMVLGGQWSDVPCSELVSLASAEEAVLCLLDGDLQMPKPGWLRDT